MDESENLSNEEDCERLINSCECPNAYHGAHLPLSFHQVLLYSSHFEGFRLLYLGHLFSCINDFCKCRLNMPDVTMDVCPRRQRLTLEIYFDRKLIFSHVTTPALS